MLSKTLTDELKAHAGSMHVLYVEDDDAIRMGLSEILRNFFNTVDTAENGQAGLEKFKNGTYDIVISDILMPKLNGVEMTEAIKMINPQQLVVITSACEENEYLMQLINLGVSSFIPKPLKPDLLFDKLHEVVSHIYNARQVAAYTEALEDELSEHKQLLEQYKEIVDITTIVSKADIHGAIIYANEAFCQISGYDHEELIGKPHSIIRHPDMPSELFKQLWETIKAKRIWQGIIKNRKKDGSYYITDTTIKPILDRHGEIVEYISVRHDITALFDLNEEIQETQHELLYVLGEVGETRSQETGNHVRRVAEYSKLLAELAQLDEEEINLLYAASPMHDIGKIGIPDHILLKPGKLSEEEFEVMKTHSQIGYQIFKNSNRPVLQAAKIIAQQHHEKWNGSGYPQGLQEEQIHIYGRITAIADVFDALSCDRIYKRAWPMDEILTFMKAQRGVHFDPSLIDLFFEHIEQFLRIREELQ